MSLQARFLRGLAISPAGVAVRVPGARITYAQAHEQALAWAGRLVEVDARVAGVLAGKTETAYIGTLAALYAGAAVVPLRPDFPAARTRQMIEAAGVTALMTDGAGLPGLTVITPGERTGQPLAEPVLSKPDDPAYVLFTSGSTGRPKGVVLTQGGFEHYFRLADERYDFSPDDVFSQSFDLNFDCALFDMFCAWGAGASAVAVPMQAYRDLPGFAAESGLTVWFSTPSAIDLVRRMGGLKPGSLAGLRWSLFAGEALTCRDAADWQVAASGSVLENLYGPTELTITVAAHRWEPGAAGVNGVVPIGRLHEGHEGLLLGDDGQPAEDEGELCVAGPQLCAGYLDPADERGRFLDHGSRRWYRTGDRVRRLDSGGGLAYLGRNDFQVQVQGIRVELAEVEQALRAAGVHDAVVLGVPGEVSTELFAFYTGEPFSPVELVRRLRESLPAAVIPKRFQHLAGFPLNSNRKVDRSRLTVEARELLAGSTAAGE
jgi:amino acid adenylation domain-containing protein